ncbi:MAG: hypothetical protein GX442_00425 [Candidatus Riflebacteria bacterium]|nr:hypothetical protein [Candidatus Riflebacteria bacterium]
MMSLEDIRVYLPKFLSPEAERELFEGLRQFPEDLPARFYLSRMSEEPIVLQGDGLRGLQVINLPDPKVGEARVIVLSNTCDVDLANPRPFFPAHLCYCPIFDLAKYQRALVESGKFVDQQIASHLEEVRRQRITQVFHLPPAPGIINESLVFLDRINSCANTALAREALREKRIFTLGTFASWLFLLKLSIHFTRFTDKVNRT